MRIGCVTTERVWVNSASEFLALQSRRELSGIESNRGLLEPPPAGRRSRRDWRDPDDFRNLENVERHDPRIH
jgi:hypothetical protein